MPSKDPSQHFIDIVDAIDSIAEFKVDIDFERFEADLKTRWAIERALLIISEAAYRLGRDADVLCPGPPWNDIRHIGNVLRHGYDALDRPRLWRTVENDLPLLRKAAAAAISKLKPQP